MTIYWCDLRETKNSSNSFFRRSHALLVFLKNINGNSVMFNRIHASIKERKGKENWIVRVQSDHHRNLALLLHELRNQYSRLLGKEKTCREFLRIFDYHSFFMNMQILQVIIIIASVIYITLISLANLWHVQLIYIKTLYFTNANSLRILSPATEIRRGPYQPPEIFRSFR